MLASVYIKDGNIHFYNEKSSLSNIGGFAYELGRPLLEFVCYEPERFDEGFAMMAEAFDNEFAYVAAKDPEYISELRKMMSEAQHKEIYLYFYQQMFFDFVLTFIDSPRKAIKKLYDQTSVTEDVLSWAWNLEWPTVQTTFVEAIIPDKEKHLFRAARDAVAILAEDFRDKLESMSDDIELLLKIRNEHGNPQGSSLEYLYALEQIKLEQIGIGFYLEQPLRSFYSVTKPPEVVELYEINTIDDLLRFEFIKMIERDIFIKKCKNCGHFFMPRRRIDAEYCDRVIEGSQRKCSEIGAMLRYERKVAENPILEAYSKAYKRFNSRTRAKKMTQSEFLSWSEQARKLREECMAGELPFDEFVEWLEKGRIRKKRGEGKK